MSPTETSGVTPAGTPAARAPLSGPERAAVVAALADAHAFYRDRLDRSWVGDYLNRRNLYAQIVPARIGYAPGGWTTTRDHLRRHGHTDATLEAAGLARRTPNGGLVDVFRDRLIVPLRTPDGTLVGFSGRAAPIADATAPKYLNSPASDVFVKHQLLLGLHEDAAALRAGAMPVVVEGPLDRLAVAQATHPLAVVGVTPCGTALSPQQATALLEAVGTRRAVAVMLNADDAGRAATRRAWEVLADAGATHLRHIALPDSKDPAELVRNGRGHALQEALYRNTPLAEAVADHTLTASGALPSTSAAQASAARRAAASATIPAEDQQHPRAQRHSPPVPDRHRPDGPRPDWQRPDWQSSLTAARQLFASDLRRVPADQVAHYVAHRLGLPADLATAAATDTVAAGPAPSNRPTARASAHTGRGPAPPAGRAATADWALADRQVTGRTR